MEMLTGRDKDFQHIALAIFRSMGITDSPAVAGSDAYTVQFDDGRLQVHLIGKQEGFMHMLSMVGAVSEKSSGEVLYALLQANQFSFDDPPFCFGVDPEIGQLAVWCKIDLARVDEARTTELFRQFVDAAKATRIWLSSNKRKSSAKRESTSNRLSRQGAPVANKRKRTRR